MARLIRLSSNWVAAISTFARFGTSRQSSSLTCSRISAITSTISPWLMLPPSCDAVGMSNNFYNLHDNIVVSLRGGKVVGGQTKLVGSSHEWLPFLNQTSGDVFLWNPLTCRRVNLPRFNWSAEMGYPDKVILSCSPDEDGDGCHAVMTYEPASGLAV